MTNEEFESALSEIRSSVDDYLKDGDVSHLARTKNAWEKLFAGERNLEASAILQAESEAEMATCAQKLENSND